MYLVFLRFSFISVTFDFHNRSLWFRQTAASSVSSHHLRLGFGPKNKDRKIPVQTVALKPLYDFPDLFHAKSSFLVHVVAHTFWRKGYKAPFLETQDHARMKDLKILVLMVALKHLYDFPRPIPCQQSVFFLFLFFHLFSFPTVSDSSRN